ncbi:PaaI family thioesterase [Polymorphum gilvum]|uniref:Medium/long-chain acyl-CoA thioesterase YigI n=1 Tax=Polymorphum gilvum (strain LMG 25793 / CGMCC 1.9160 / SL003B-26A1) TaxID=991905 RepID=F2IV01_POLGS|nr:PaaI family thioesterase [Polymorphum gilvum]ADZ70230.1 Thioesterase superfamily protein [Polymorphum gilvum SL003B-26A1]
MSAFEPKDPDWEVRVRASYARQPFMEHLGAVLSHLAPGEADIAMAFRPELTQQHGFFHAGTTTSIADSAAGYAALTLYPQGTGVLTTEFKINLLNPGRGARLVARGRVLKPGRTLTVCRADVYGLSDGGETHVATGLFSMICLEGMAD